MVSPPSMQCDIERIKKFFPYEMPTNLHAEEVMLVTSTDDPYLTPEEAVCLQEALGVEMTVVEQGGHLNESSGYGAWEWVWDWVKKGEKHL